jgi:hypothetical protein|tara:strand:- start:204 stop:383 length:180 start_codon:yes stop_codon:yes gene_type:complete
MTTNDIKQLAVSLTEANPSEAARIWLNVAANKSLAIQVHKTLTKDERQVLANKLMKAGD